MAHILQLFYRLVVLFEWPACPIVNKLTLYAISLKEKDSHGYKPTDERNFAQAG